MLLRPRPLNVVVAIPGALSCEPTHLFMSLVLNEFSKGSVHRPTNHLIRRSVLAAPAEALLGRKEAASLLPTAPTGRGCVFAGCTALPSASAPAATQHLAAALEVDTLLLVPGALPSGVW